MPTVTIDWPALSRRLQDEMTKLVHHEQQARYGDDFYAEALRRAFGFAANDGTDGRRQLPYETVEARTGMVTEGQHQHELEGHTIMSRLRAEAAEKRLAEVREETQARMRDARKVMADWLRQWTNDRTVPSRLRREGVLLAADWLDPSLPSNPTTTSRR